MAACYEDNGSALLLSNDGQDLRLMYGYGISPGFYQEDGVIRYAGIEESYRDYLTMCRSWYEKGYIYSDFMSLGMFPETSLLW